MTETAPYAMLRWLANTPPASWRALFAAILYEKERPKPMTTIALCDDEAEQRLEIARLLADYRAAHPGAELRETAFSAPEALLERVESEGAFDLYLLDILMPGQNGIALGMELRKLDAKGVLIYLTSSPDYAVDSYQAGAFYYLLKPVRREQLFSVLDRALEAAAGPDRGLIVKTREGLRRLDTQAIQYGELSARRIRYVLSDGSAVQGTTLRGAFRDAVAPLLERRQFVLCAASFVVNLAYVETVERDSVGLKDGRRLPLSRSFRDEVIDRWMDYHLEGGLPGR